MDGLLQPFVDGELTDEERNAVASYLERNLEARQLVCEQQRVRSALRALDKERAPAALSARVLLDLDAVDAERTAAPVHRRVYGPVLAMARGALLMLPAAAAAATLFYVVRDPANLSIPGAHMDGGTALQLAATEVGVEPPAAEPTPSEPFTVQVAARPALPPNVELVSDHAKNALATQATVQYADRKAGVRFLDLQRPAGEGTLEGTQRVFRGLAYHLSRDAGRRPRVEFDHAGVRHRLVFAGEAPMAPGEALDVEHPDFGALLEVADALRRH
jgi:hypothetical protein